MPRAHAGVKESELFGQNIFVAVSDIPVFRSCKEWKLFRQPALRMPLDPIATERIVHHIANDPIRREQLRGGRDILFFDGFAV